MTPVAALGVSRIPGLLGAGWIILTVSGLGPDWAGWVHWVGEVGRGMTASDHRHLFRPLGDALAVAGLVSVLLLAVLLAGSRLGRVLNERMASGVSGPAAHACLGWGVVSLAFFGLALAGLFHAGVLFSVVGLLAVGETRVIIRDRWWEHGASLVPSRRLAATWVLVGAPAGMAALFAFVPSYHIDCFQYHYAAPEHWLRLHKFNLDGTTNGFHLMLAGEMLNALGVACHQEPACTWMAAIPFMAALAFIGSWISRLVGDEAAGVSTGLIAGLPSVLWVLGTGKNDLAATGLCLYAIARQVSRSPRHAPVAWGMACAAKTNMFAFAGTAWAWGAIDAARRARPSWRPHVAGLALLLTPLAPWLIKEWILTGDPFWPALSGWFPGSRSDPRTEAALSSMLGSMPGLFEGIRSYADAVLVQHPVMLAALPAVLLLWRRIPIHVREMAVVVLAAGAIFTWTVHYEMERLLLPVFCVCCLLIGVVFDRLLAARPAWMATGGVIVVAAYAWSPAGSAMLHCRNANDVRYLTGDLDRNGLMEAGLTTSWETRKRLGELKDVRTTVLVNDHAPYRWPGRTITETMPGRKPTWMYTREAGDLDRLVIRLRQDHVSHLAFNFVQEFSSSGQAALTSAYGWNARQLRLLYDLMQRHMAVDIPPSRCDSTNGGYYVYRLMRAPQPPAALVPYLPGIQEVLERMKDPITFRQNRNGARTIMERMIAVYPDVGEFAVSEAVAAFGMRDYRDVERRVSPLIASGMMFEYGHGFLAVALLNLGRYADALKVAEAGRGKYPGQEGSLHQLEVLAREGLAEHDGR